MGNKQADVQPNAQTDKQRWRIKYPGKAALVALFAVLAVAFYGSGAIKALDNPRDFDVTGYESDLARHTALDRANKTLETGMIAVVDGKPGGKRAKEFIKLLKQTKGISKGSIVAPVGQAQLTAAKTALSEAQTLPQMQAAGKRLAVLEAQSKATKRLIAKDGKSLVIAAKLKNVKQPEPVVMAIEKGIHESKILNKNVALGGIDVAYTQINDQSEKDLKRGELFAFPILALLSLLLFRGVASLLPIIVGGTSVLASFAVLRGLNEIFAISPFALNLVIGLGLGLAVDYSLFMVSRFREELGEIDSLDQHAIDSAIVKTLATAGRTVIFSAATVAAALACLLVFPQTFLWSMGLGGITVAVVAAAVSILLLPVAFKLLGARLGKVKPGPTNQGIWYRLSHKVLRRPGLVAVGTSLLILLIAAPATHLKWSNVGPDLLPTSQSARVASDRLAKDFPGVSSTPIQVLAHLDKSKSSRKKLQKAINKIKKLDGVNTNAPVRPVVLAKNLWQFEVATKNGPGSASTQELVKELRGAKLGFKNQIGGWPTQFYDQKASISKRLPLALVILTSLSFVVLWLLTGSVILPIKTLIMNLLTVAATAGILVFVFQDGNFASLFGSKQQPGIDQTNFLLVFATAFALSTDYGVFVLTRIKEARDSGLSEHEAVAVGLQKSGGIVSAAAILLAVALGAFLTAHLVFLKQLGLGSAAAVLLDAFIVRSLLVTSLMGLLGKWNWWSPAWLRRLHDRVGLSEG